MPSAFPTLKNMQTTFLPPNKNKIDFKIRIFRKKNPEKYHKKLIH